MEYEDEEPEEKYVDEDSAYESWREYCSIDFSVELEEFLAKFYHHKNDYMSNPYHLESGLRSMADYIKKYPKEFAERMKALKEKVVE